MPLLLANLLSIGTKEIFIIMREWGREEDTDYCVLTIIASVILLLPLPSCVQGLQLVRVSREGDKISVTSLLNSGVDPNFRHMVKLKIFLLNTFHTCSYNLVLVELHFITCIPTTCLYITNAHTCLHLLISHTCANTNKHMYTYMPARMHIRTHIHTQHTQHTHTHTYTHTHTHTHAPLDTWPPQDEMSALLWASINGHTEVVRLLLDCGANIHAVDEVLETLNYRQANCWFSSSTKSTWSPPSLNFGELYFIVHNNSMV